MNYDARRVDRSTADEAVRGLSGSPKTLPAKLFYDSEGCRLFGEITRLPEYYVTRTELQLLQDIAPELPADDGPQALVEYGASDELKALILLEGVGIKSYVPIDVSSEALDGIVSRLRNSHPDVDVYPIATDFMADFELPSAIGALNPLGFFPGSTIGNLDPGSAVTLLHGIAATLGRRAYLLIGVDLVKSSTVLLPAYDDAAQVTAAFNLNMLVRLNREADANFVLDCFRHEARWNAVASRIEMHLVSLKHQIVEVAGRSFAFQRGESIHTENSYKHTVTGFQALAKQAGWTPVTVWTDQAELFAVHLLQATA